MNTAIGLSFKKPMPPSDSLSETKLLKYFANLKGTSLFENERALFGKKYFIFEAYLGEYVGIGRGPTRFVACLKAIAECLERKFMASAFAGPLRGTPKWLQTSNGFAVHMNITDARKAAYLEAMERHILQMTYLKEGWAGFRLLDQRIDQELTLTRVVSRYSCNGFGAGLVIATSSKFSGVSLGYICEQALGIESSSRWAHAHNEAIDKIEPMLAIHNKPSQSTLSPIDDEQFAWLLGPRLEFEFSNDLSPMKLPLAEIKIQDFDLMSSWGLTFPFFGAFASGKNILPLIVPKRVRSEDAGPIHTLLEALGLPSNIPETNPIL